MNRYRKSSGEWCLTHVAFRKLDYGQTCQALGLRPSKPNASAAKLARSRRSR